MCYFQFTLFKVAVSSLIFVVRNWRYKSSIVTAAVVSGITGYDDEVVAVTISQSPPVVAQQIKALTS